jgi:glycine betaine/proline transport system substrate-binding protein
MKVGDKKIFSRLNIGRRRLFATVAITSFAFGVAACGGSDSSSGGGAVESEDPIVITLHDWTGQLLTSNIMAAVLEKAGYNTELVQADYLAQFAGLETGDLHLAMEIWATTGQEAMDASLATGKTLNFGENGMVAREEWWYPEYMKERCPGLPEWEALKKCSAEFATPETAPKGRYLGGPVTWGGFDEERVDALGLDFEVVHAGTDAALFAELESAYERKDPIVLWIYQPHWAPVKYAGEFVEFPPYTPECYTDPTWGSTSKAYDCGKPVGPIWKVGWAGLGEKWPGAKSIIEAFKLSNEDMGAMVAKVDLDGESLESVVDKWMSDNESVWKAWIGA